MTKDKTALAAAGAAEFDLVLRNVNYVNVLTKEIYTADIGVCDGRIAHVTQPGEEQLNCSNVYEATGKYAIPGLIDTHVHIESSMMTPAHMAEAVVPHGTTSIACDPHEIANVLGMEGVEYILEASRDIPLNVFVLAPSCVPSAEGLETSGAVFTAETIEKLLSLDRVIGLAEVMDFPGVIHQSPRIMSIIEAARRHGVFLQGHAPSLTGRQLSAYQISGVNSCHETSFTQEAFYKLRAGMTLECRESSIVHDIAAIAPALKALCYPPNATLCTDDREPDDLLREGHIDHVIRRCIAEGIPVMEAVRMATYNAAALTGLTSRGTLIPGKTADIVLLDDWEEFRVNEVFVEGRLTARDGRLMSASSPHSFPIERRNTVILNGAPKRGDFLIAAPGSEVRVNVMSFRKQTPVLTDLETLTLPVRNGYVDVSDDASLAYIAVFERHSVKGAHAAGIVKNLGLKYGAIASTLSHDCHNLVVIGRNPDDMKAAAESLMRCGGGLVCVLDGHEKAKLGLPIAGLMSDKPIEELAPITAAMKKAIKDFGLIGECPIIQMGSLSLPVIPHVRFTDLGLADVLEQKQLPVLP